MNTQLTAQIIDHRVWLRYSPADKRRRDGFLAGSVENVQDNNSFKVPLILRRAAWLYWPSLSQAPTVRDKRDFIPPGGNLENVSYF